MYFFVKNYERERANLLYKKYEFIGKFKMMCLHGVIFLTVRLEFISDDSIPFHCIDWFVNGRF